MTLPTFLGIGAQRCGTTWLYEVLKSHPDIGVPRNVKEVHFFDRHYDKGVDWYESFFDDSYEVRGEVTPMYLYDERVPERVSQDVPEAKFVVILRNPAERANSQYKNAYLNGETTKKTLEAYIDANPNCFDRGLYYRQLKRWFHRFEREQVQIHVFEDLVENPQKATSRLAEFLDVEDRFDLPGEVNSSFQPVFHSLYQVGITLHDFLKKHELYGMARALEKGGKLFRATGKQFQGGDPKTVERLLEQYRPSIKRLEDELDIYIEEDLNTFWI